MFNLPALTFAWPWLIALLPLVWLVWWWLPAGVLSAPRVPFADTWRAASTDGSAGGLLRPRTLLMLAAWLCLVLALMRPQIPGDRDELLLSGRQMMLLVDLSLSMSIEDMRTDGRQTDRLIAVKAILDDFIPERDGDQLGLIVFGSQAYVHVPITPDLDMIQQLAGEMEVGMAGPRTALGEAVALGVLHLEESIEEGDRVIVLLSDGAQTIGSVFPPEAGVLARDNDVTIHAIGFGSDSGGPDGSTSDLDEPALTMLAESTGGEYFRARTQQDLESIYEAIDRIEPTESGQRFRRQARDVFHWPASIALFCILAAGLIRFHQTRRGQSDEEAL